MVIIPICKLELALNNPQWLMCRETQTTNQTNIKLKTSEVYYKLFLFISNIF